MLLIVLALSFASAQDTLEIAQTLRDLSNTGVLMDISAHPDDEDGATLAYYRMKYGVHTYSVLFTRGEGGQNEKGSELYEDLGVIRSAETRAAGKILGTEVEFLNFPDFGYSKTATEAFRVWGGQQEALRRLVYVIRRFRPDVLFSNHNTWGGHGHHQAAAITAIAAFDAAADSSMFPEQLREPGISAWQPKKLFFRVFGASTAGADVVHNLEEVNDLRGKPYIDIATAALRMHRTQGMERADLRAFSRSRSAYRLVRASSMFEQDSTDFFSSVWSWDDEPLKSFMTVANEVHRLRSDQPWDSLVAASAALLARLDPLVRTPSGTTLAGERILRHWRDRLEHLAVAAAGVVILPKYDDTLLVARQRVHITLQASAMRGHLEIDSISWSLPRGWSAQSGSAVPGTNTRDFTMQVGERPQLTYPPAEHLYRPIGDGNPSEVSVAYALNGHPLEVQCAIVVDVTAPQLLRTSPDILLVRPRDASAGVSLTCRVTNMFPHKSAGNVMVSVPSGWRGSGFSFAIETEGGMESGTIELAAPRGIAEGDYTALVRTEFGEHTLLIRVADVKFASGVRVGFVTSYDTTIVASLRESGVRCDTLDDSRIANGDLRTYHTIILDMRAYLIRDAIRRHNDRLMEYVRQGGNLVVMYQRDVEWKPEYAPYPFGISRQRVTMEDAPVNVLKPDHPLLNWPNRILPHDWIGWKQERSVYLPVHVPPEYDRLIACHDPDEPEGDTGYICASVGKGSYIYTSYVWYRQLNDRHPGALRCLANMISYPLRPH
jgi:LmbE family N-acetylglucosaminyl deacetylase